MNYSDLHGVVWFAPMRTGTRAIANIFRRLKFINGNSDQKRFQTHSHRLQVPPGKEEYQLLCSVRNPYTRAQSLFRWGVDHSSIGVSFDEWLDAVAQAKESWVFYEKDLPCKPTLIRLEHLADDLQALPMVKNSMGVIGSYWDHFVLRNAFPSKSETPQYTEEIAEKVFHAFQAQFDLFGYEKDSWLENGSFEKVAKTQ